MELARDRLDFSDRRCERRKVAQRQPLGVRLAAHLVGGLPASLFETGRNLGGRQPRDRPRRSFMTNRKRHDDLSLTSALISMILPGPRRFSSSAVSLSMTP